MAVRASESGRSGMKVPTHTVIDVASEDQVPACDEGIHDSFGDSQIGSRMGHLTHLVIARISEFEPRSQPQSASNPSPERKRVGPKTNDLSEKNPAPTLGVPNIIRLCRHGHGPIGSSDPGLT